MNEAHATVLLKIIFINKAVLRQFYVNLCNTMYEVSLFLAFIRIFAFVLKYKTIIQLDVALNLYFSFILYEGLIIKLNQHFMKKSKTHLCIVRNVQTL